MKPGQALDDILFALETSALPLFFLACRRRFRWPADKLRAWQQAAALRSVRYAARHSPYFRRVYAGLDLSDFSSLPLQDKRLMMENLSDWNTMGLSKEEILSFCLDMEKSRDFSRRLRGLNVGMSSGTSGNKGVEMVTRREESCLRAALLARFDFPKKEKLNVAFILRVTSPAFNLDLMGHRLSWVSQLQPMEEIIRKLDDIDPNVLSAPPSMLNLLAREKEAGRLSITPKRLISYAETLHPDVRRRLERVFACPLHEIYKATEGSIAITCKEGRLHVNEDLVFLETLEPDGSPTPPGKPCRNVLVTDLLKRAAPIIRYRLNDILTISPEACPCGSSFRVIERVQGRSDDLFWARRIRDGAWQFIFPDYVSRAIISSSEDIDEYQVIQEAPAIVSVRLSLKSPGLEESFDRDAVAGSLRALFREYGCAEPAVRVAFGPPERNPSSDKLIRIHRNFKAEGIE